MTLRIVPGHVHDHRKGVRLESTLHVSTAVYDVEERITTTRSDGGRDVRTTFYTEAHPHAMMLPDAVDTNVAVVALAEGGFVEFDTRWLRVDPGEAVHVVVHRILGRSHADLYHDRMDMWASRADPKLSPPGRAIPTAAAIAAFALLRWLGMGTAASLQWALAAGLVLFGLHHLRNQYIDKRLRMSRLIAGRRLRKATQYGRIIDTR